MPTTASLYIGATQIITTTTPPAPNAQSITTSLTWTMPVGARLVFAQLVGGGGGSNSYYGVPGAGGEYACMLFLATALPSTVSVTIGAGGRSADITNSTDVASNGGDTIFAGLTAFGGGAGLVQWAGASFTDASNHHAAAAAFSGVRLPASGGYSAASLWVGTSPTLLPESNFAGGAFVIAGAGNARLGAGAGSVFTSPAGLGGTKASSLGALQAGNGGNQSAAPTAPGGGAGCGNSSATVFNGAPGAALITTYF